MSGLQYAMHILYFCMPTGARQRDCASFDEDLLQRETIDVTAFDPLFEGLPVLRPVHTGNMLKATCCLSTCWSYLATSWSCFQHVEDTGNMLPVSGNKLKAFADRNPVLATCWSKLNMFNFWQHVEGPSNKLPLMFPVWTCCCLLQQHVERFMGRHLGFPTSGYIWQYSQYCHRVAGPRKCGDSRWSGVAI